MVILVQILLFTYKVKFFLPGSHYWNVLYCIYFRIGLVFCLIMVIIVLKRVAWTFQLYVLFWDVFDNAVYKVQI